MHVPPGGFTPETAKGFFTQYCVTCHNQYAKIADMVLDTRDFEQISADADIWERVVRKLNAAGVPFLAGTDTPAGVDVIPGISLHLELQRFVAAGFTPLEALQTATLNPAKFYNKLNDFGTVQPGRIADLVLLEANPLDNIANTRKITAVITDGRYLSQQDLEQLRTKLKQLAATK